MAQQAFGSGGKQSGDVIVDQDVAPAGVLPGKCVSPNDRLVGRLL